mmetsp:Transcript_64737/g.107569  ORF Transcript_64737/g.107569 Transcript_64737/m.107569 type:complete len:271 (+) Transcript_64737:7-819(+)
MCNYELIPLRYCLLAICLHTLFYIPSKRSHYMLSYRHETSELDIDECWRPADEAIGSDILSRSLPNRRPHQCADSNVFRTFKSVKPPSKLSKGSGVAAIGLLCAASSTFDVNSSSKGALLTLPPVQLVNGMPDPAPIGVVGTPTPTVDPTPPPMPAAIESPLRIPVPTLILVHITPIGIVGGIAMPPIGMPSPKPPIDIPPRMSPIGMPPTMLPIGMPPPMPADGMPPLMLAIQPMPPMPYPVFIGGIAAAPAGIVGFLQMPLDMAAGAL